MELLDPLLLARWQFGLTTLYHYLFVPLTLGMALVTAIFQTVWHRTGDVKWLHLTRLFGKIFLINFAMGVVFGWCYRRWGRVMPLVIAHTLIDIVAFIGYPLAVTLFPGVF